MEYKYFFIAIRRYRKGRISRREFLSGWEYAQCRQGISTVKRGRDGAWRKS